MTREWYNVCQKTRPDVSRNCASCLRNNGTRKTPLSFVGHVFIFVLVYSFILCQSSTSNLGRRWAGIGQPAKAGQFTIRIDSFSRIRNASAYRMISFDSAFTKNKTKCTALTSRNFCYFNIKIKGNQEQGHTVIICLCLFLSV